MQAKPIDPSEYTAILAEATRVFGTSEMADQWMHQKLLVLDATPMSLLDTEPGRAEVRKILSAIATGGIV